MYAMVSVMRKAGFFLFAKQEASMTNAKCFSMVLYFSQMTVKKHSIRLNMKELSQQQQWRNSIRISARRSSRLPFNVFISHRGSETKLNIAAVMYDRLVEKNLKPFLDYRSMKPGELLNEAIEAALRECKVGLVIFSSNFCSSDNCLEELASMMALKKQVIPIFYNVRVSDLAIVDDGSFQPKQFRRFCSAVEMAKARVGIVFNSCEGDWSHLLNIVSDRVIEILKELEDENIC